jgi:hypothetical protein
MTVAVRMHPLHLNHFCLAIFCSLGLHRVEC